MRLLWIWATFWTQNSGWRCGVSDLVLTGQSPRAAVNGCAGSTQRSGGDVIPTVVM